ncbi:HlyD family secretion protein [Chitinophaga deserti]|uniref:HlyD family secretion protein n=1 Tax=Chitinophaga deserti TaxID=2164099 RepID=UPI000D6BB8DD|nr:HlyD family secretion protein [Chitinophaga deserti]
MENDLIHHPHLNGTTTLLPSETIHQPARRSELAQEVISHQPGFMEKWALCFFAGILLVLGFITWFIRYPDIIEGRATLTAENAPKEITIMHDGRLIRLFTPDSMKVKKNEVLGWIESTASHQEVLSLSGKLDTGLLLLQSNRYAAVVSCFSAYHHNLGEVQEPYRQFIIALQQFDDYLVNGYYAREAGLLKTDVETLDETRGTIENQLELTKQDLQIAEESFVMNKTLFDGKIIAREEYRNEQSRFLSKKMVVPQLNASLLANMSQKRDKQKEIARMEHDISRQRVLFMQTLLSFRQVVDEWKKKYTIIAPIAGDLVLDVPVQENQFLQQGRRIGYITPGQSRYFAEIHLPQANLGKIDTGLQVQLRFAAYPYQETGYVKGTINYVSKVATDSGLVATVQLDNGLMTNQQVPLVYKTGLQAQGLVITKNMRLIDRLMHNLFRNLAVNP